ncbi:hypothetical protein UCRPC4_g06618 [Phaeomoniella chlamydospora]|uniref:Uncharacterized protein n=1 Tax=Phaeomoniella chlamydospora TaxID=158046 RepID=A0A0G2GCU6_PHACM|nr:hypothetical protein UCRPC4_g06618 [Phaeomoniella chlamydospora]
MDSESESELSETESVNYESADEGDSPIEPMKDAKMPGHTRTKSSVAEDVIGRKGQYGRFAAQWFSRSGWSQERKRTLGMSTERQEGLQEPEAHLNVAVPATQSQIDPQSSLRDNDGRREQQLPDTTFPLTSRILRTTRALLSSKCFYFSYDVNITRRLGGGNSLWSKPPTGENADELYTWNKHMAQPFIDAGQNFFFLPIMQGFVGQRAFIAQRQHSGEGHTEAVESLEKILEADRQFRKNSDDRRSSKQPQSFLLTIISRRSIKRSGLRYLRRGIDDEGNAANTVETEQILSSPTWDTSLPVRSFVQIRGSIPLYFSQSPYSFKPIPILHQSKDANQTAFKSHFEELGRRYGAIQIAVLVDKHGSEAGIGEEYESFVKRYNEQQRDQLDFEWFDFHSECRGMKFENVQKLVTKLEGTLKSHGETVLNDRNVVQKQSGIIRSNCMDCLDRTNVVESALAQHVLEQHLRKQGFDIDFQIDPSTQWFNNLWADNGDAISRQYAGTAALKGDFTRTRKRNVRGALNDFSLTLSRYYNNIVNDYFSQNVIDYLMGNVSIQAFEDFEADMMNTDPGVSLERIRQKAIETCSKITIQNEKEDLLQGWTMLSPSLPNTLRSLPFQESVVLLTDHAIYNCKFDWNTEKVGSFERIDLHSITNIHYGPYVTSVLTERQLDESRNIGLVITYNPGKGNIIRVNTRSLQNSVDPAKNEPAVDNSGEGTLFSWLARGSEQPRFMAMKLLPVRSLAGGLDGSLMAQLEQIIDDIQRAVKNIVPSDQGPQDGVTVKKMTIVSAEDAKKNTGYLEQLGHQVKKLVWG